MACLCKSRLREAFASSAILPKWGPYGVYIKEELYPNEAHLTFRFSSATTQSRTDAYNRALATMGTIADASRVFGLTVNHLDYRERNGIKQIDPVASPAASPSVVGRRTEGEFEDVEFLAEPVPKAQKS